MAALRSERGVRCGTAAQLRRVLRDLSLGQSPPRCRGLRCRLRKRAMGRARRAARRPAALHRRKHRRISRRAKKLGGLGQYQFSRSFSRRHAFERQQHGFRLQLGCPAPFARSGGRRCRVREKAQTRRADARLYLLRVRQPACVVSSAVASERPFPPASFARSVSVEIGNRRSCHRLRLLAIGTRRAAR